jgi:lipopolysaccharide transport system ATP-binding protein
MDANPIQAGPNLALEAEGLGKAYRSYPSVPARWVEVASLGRLKRHRKHWALRDVGFQLARGASLGLIGANGAGKSTLLKILSGTSAPSAGRFRAHGRIAALLELGTGFHPDFTGRENVLMNGLLLGCTRAEMKRRMDGILAFSELGDAVEEPVRTYSTGMAMRLGFATALGLEPEILLLDEVFAVGDLYFQKKCVDRLFDYRNRGGTLLLCSHSLYDVRQICEDALWLRDGCIASAGESVRVTNEYAAWQRERLEESEERAIGAPANQEASTPLRPRLLAVQACNPLTGQPIHAIESGSALDLRIWWENPVSERVHLGVTLTRQDQTLASGLATHLDGFDLAADHGCCTLHLPRLELLAGTFTVLVYLFDAFGVHRYQELCLPQPLVVGNRTREVGLVRLDHAWSVRTDLPTPRSASSALGGAA